MKMILFLNMFFLVGCSMDDLLFWQDDDLVSEEGQVGPAVAENEEDEDDEEEDDGDEKTPKNKYLKIPPKINLAFAKINHRLETLESQLRRQKEDFHVLRKGLMTGLIPSQWQEDIPKYSSGYLEGRKGPHHSEKTDTLSVILSEDEGGGGKGFSGMSDRDRRKYEKRLAKANHHFRSGDYGKAILTYTEIGRDYSDRVTKGSHLLWIGASWYRLKDYQSSRKHLTKLIKRYKTSPWVPEAEFLLAKADYREGYLERALDSLKDIVRKYPNENISDRAREELKRVEDNL